MVYTLYVVLQYDSSAAAFSTGATADKEESNCHINCATACIDCRKIKNDKRMLNDIYMYIYGTFDI